MKQVFKTAFFAVLFLYLVFQQAILTLLPQWRILSYVDETLMCVFAVCIILKMLRRPVKLLRAEQVMIIMTLLFLVFGLASTLIEQMQNAFLSASDAMICCRFVVYYLAVRVLPSGKDTRQMIRTASICARVSAIVLLILSLHELFFTRWFPVFDVRLGFQTLRLFFPHPTYLAFCCFTLAVPLMVRMGVKTLKCRRDLVYIIILFFVTFLSGRSKAIGALGCSLLVWLLFVILKNHSKAFIVVAGAILAGAIGGHSFSDYFINNDRGGAYAIRFMMHSDSVRLANERFPFGTGFGTFGSAVAAEHYSPVYYTLGYNGIWGMAPTRTDYLCDTFWPIVIAQTGWIGAAAFVIVIACFAVIAFRAVNVNRYLAWALLSVIIYELISSIAETAFFNPASCVMFAMFALGVNWMLYEKEE